MKPKKLIRDYVTELVKLGEWEVVEDQAEINKLYHLKIQEELQKVIESHHTDVNEFADLFQVVIDFAAQNGVRFQELASAADKKMRDKGRFRNLALNNLNPENPSNKLYFESAENDAYSKAASSVLAEILEHEEEIISSPIRFNGVHTEKIKQVFEKAGVKIDPAF